MRNTCRAFLSPWFERGGMEPADENDKPVYIGRNNLGAISLNLPMILAKARQESKDFYEVLDHYLEMIRRLHKRTYDYLGEMKASINPLMFCQGGFYGGHLGLNDKIRPLLKTSTMSFGFTALNELQQLYNRKSLVEDGQFAIDVMAHINAKINEFKQEDKILYAIYGTPAESLCMSGDTEVQCYNGNKQIKDIEIGDLVYSYNEELKKVELKKVVNSFRSKVNAEVVKVTFDNGQEIICTPEHPFGIRCMNQNELGEFISEEVRYYKASELKSGMRVKSNYIKLNASGRLISSNSKVDDNFYAASYWEYIPKDEAISLNHKVVSVEKMTTKIDVYDIEVEDNHNFYVGGDEGILVHNCGTQVKQFRAKYGIIQNVSDRDYFSNSFHCHVSEDITPTQKQDLEKRFWNLSNGGKIQYVRYRSEKNLAAISTLVDRAMKFGFYEGINMDKDYCEDCGYNGIDFEDEICPVCKSDNVVILNRVCGYLGYSKVHGKSRMNDSKMAEVKDRISM